MKKILLTITCVCLAATALASDPSKKPSYAGFTSNGFWDNWEISAGAGVGTAITNGVDLGKLGERIGVAGDFSIAKWMHPVVGMRLQLQGGRFLNFDAARGQMQWPYLFAHADLLVNLSNWAGGYREDRAYYLVPFVGFGYMASNFTAKSQRNNGCGTRQEIAAAYGLLNKFRLSPAVDFNIELKGLFAPSTLSPATPKGHYAFGFTATVGFTCRFNKRGWSRCTANYTAADVLAFQEAIAVGQVELAAVAAENARLAEALAAAQAAPVVAAAPVQEAATPEQLMLPVSMILYDCNATELSPKEQTRLEMLATQIKNGPTDKVYTIQGHADVQTGTATRNQTLSEERAKRVYDFLVKQGVNPKQLTYEGLGDRQNPYKENQRANRSAIVVE